MRSCARCDSGGKITQRGSFSKPGTAWRGMAPRSAGTSMLEQPWSTRVVGRRMTGVLYRSDSSKAARVMAYASSGVAGSKTGTWANCANWRLSCSVWLLMGPGSSATTTTRPPRTPT